MSRSGSLAVSLRGASHVVLGGSLYARSVGTATGPGTALHVVSSSLAGGRLVQEMGPLATWYQVTPAGLEQGFTVYRPPAGGGDDLVIGLGPATGWALVTDGSALVERSPHAPTSLFYGGLEATDAAGSVHACRLRVAHGTVQVVVHVARGAYPLDVDPTWSSSPSPAATLSEPSIMSTAEESFGSSVAMSADGTTALVGAAADAGTGAGAAYVFHISREGSWASSPVAILSGGDPGDHFGSSVAMSADGTTALVSASGSAGTGWAAVFHVSSEGAWASSSSPAAVLNDPGYGGQDYFGCSVAMSADGTTVLVGADGESGTGVGPGQPFGSMGPGAAYVFHASSEASWATSSKSPAVTLTGSRGASFGSLVAMSADGTTALVSATQVLYVFHVLREASWGASSSKVTTAILTKPGATASSVAMSADGSTALIGAYGASSGKGAAYVFHASSKGPWASSSAPAATLAEPRGGTARDDFGGSVAISADGTTALVGADGVNGAGAAYVFHASSEASWASSSAPVRPTCSTPRA
jgi:hypothetical protein